MTNENLFRSISFVLTLSAFSISVYFRSKARKTSGKVSTESEGKLILLLRSVFGFGMWLGVVLYFINPGWLQWSQYPAPDWLRGTALGLMALCLPGFYWLFYSLGKNITPTTATRESHALITRGPYRYIRHPLYTFGFVFFISLSLAAANWFMLILMIVGYGVILARTPIEEKQLIEKFGEEYREYMELTGRYLPKCANRR